jgi:uncharacterized protein YjiS (DUF1127 family)
MATQTNFLGRIANRFLAWRERERAFAELSALDDRTLADLGLRRGDIPFVVYCQAQDRRPASGTSPANANLETKGLRAA